LDLFPLAIFLPRIVWTALHKYGVLVFIGMGLIDNSIFPTPGGMDALVIVLSAHRREAWWYYATAATVGSVIGAYLTYYLARKGGEEALGKRVGKKREEKVRRVFGRYGFWSVFLSSLAPPPMPTAAFVAAAGALRYSQKMFLLAMTSGRVLRFAIVAWVASRYGTHIFQFFGRYYKPALWTLIGLAVVGGIVALIYWRRKKREKASEPAVPAQKAA
jgi:membrane protein YqaA with SNARE-associated domain